MSRGYLKSNIRPLTNVRKLFWRLISVAELSAIAPNICRIGREVGGHCVNASMQNTAAVTMVTSTDTTTMATATMTTAMTPHTTTGLDSGNNDHRSTLPLHNTHTRIYAIQSEPQHIQSISLLENIFHSFRFRF